MWVCEIYFVPAVVADIGVKEAVTSLILDVLGGGDDMLDVRFQHATPDFLADLERVGPLFVLGGGQAAPGDGIATGLPLRDVMRPGNFSAHELLVNGLVVGKCERVVGGVFGST